MGLSEDMFEGSKGGGPIDEELIYKFAGSVTSNTEIEDSSHYDTSLKGLHGVSRR